MKNEEETILQEVPEPEEPELCDLDPQDAIGLAIRYLDGERFNVGLMESIKRALLLDNDCHAALADSEAKAARVEELEKWILSLPPGGSEFHNELETCKRWVEERSERMKLYHRENRALQAENERMRQALLGIRDVFSELGGFDLTIRDIDNALAAMKEAEHVS